MLREEELKVCVRGGGGRREEGGVHFWRANFQPLVKFLKIEKKKRLSYLNSSQNRIHIYAAPDGFCSESVKNAFPSD